MNRSDQDKLLRELLADERVEAIRTASLAGALTALRGRRRRRAFLAGGAASLAVLAAAFVALHRRADPIETAPAIVPATASRVVTINDAELLALFSNRSVALVGTAGDQKLLFLDQPKKSTRNP